MKRKDKLAAVARTKEVLNIAETQAWVLVNHVGFPASVYDGRSIDYKALDKWLEEAGGRLPLDETDRAVDLQEKGSNYKKEG